MLLLGMLAAEHADWDDGVMSGLEVGRHRIPEADLQWRFSRASGPGGQSVNTADSRVQLSFDLAGTSALPAVLRDRALARLNAQLVDGVVTITASEHRSQWRNRQAALARLQALLQHAVAPGPPARRATRPTLGSDRRRLEGKRLRSQTKQARRRPGGEA